MRRNEATQLTSASEFIACNSCFKGEEARIGGGHVLKKSRATSC
jgi:hypothetical protein